MAKTAAAENAALVLSAALVLAFLVSFGTGLRFGSGAPRQPAPELRTPVADPGSQDRGRVEVLNASGSAGLARTATATLRSAGFDVVYYGNAPESMGDSTVVIDRTGNTAVARAVAQQLGISRVLTRVDSSLILDATVVLGKTFQNRSPD
jgi:hypothetical protein